MLDGKDLHRLRNSSPGLQKEQAEQRRGPLLSRTEQPAGTLVLDCEGLVKWCQADQRVTALVREAQDNDFRVVVSALTPIEAQGARTKPDRLRRYLSRLRIEPVTEEISLAAIDLSGWEGP